MQRVILILVFLVIISCQDENKKKVLANIESVELETIYEDSLSIRALEILNDGSLAFAGSDGKFGLYNPTDKKWVTNIIKEDSLQPSFRATGHTTTDFFMLSVANPALLFKTGENGQMQPVYYEEGEKVFYDALKFWNDREGIAMGDPTDNCLSIIITRDGGNTWNKLNCEDLPSSPEGEAAFAASNTNIKIMGNKAWIITGGMKSRVFYTPDKGKNWEVFDTPLIQGTSTQGGYSMDFYDKMEGFIIGGDYTNPDLNTGNKARTEDGGRTWTIVSDGKEPGYKSCVQYVPKMSGNELVAVGFTGISYSADKGNSWKSLSEEGFYTIRFINDSTAYGAGKNRISKIIFKREKL